MTCWSEDSNMRKVLLLHESNLEKLLIHLPIEVLDVICNSIKQTNVSPESMDCKFIIISDLAGTNLSILRNFNFNNDIYDTKVLFLAYKTEQKSKILKINTPKFLAKLCRVYSIHA